MTLVTAAEGTRILVTQEGAPKRVPTGVVHAYDMEEKALLCGRDLSAMSIFVDQEWGEGFFDRCYDCLTAATSLFL